LFLDEVAERPYRLHRMLTQLHLSGRLSNAAAIVFGQLPRCDEPGGKVTARDVILDVLATARSNGGFHRPALFGFPSRHPVPPTVSLPLGVQTAVVGQPDEPRVIVEEAAASE